MDDQAKTKEQLIEELALLRENGKCHIIEHETAEEVLKKEKELAQEYLNIVGVMVVIINNRKEVDLINKKGCEILGYQKEEIVGKNWFDHFLPRRLRAEVNAVADKLFSGDIEPVEYYENPVLTKSGEEKIIAWHNTVLRNEKGEIISLLTSGEDITERKQGEERLKKTMREKETLLKEVHHRVKNNLLNLYSLVNLQQMSLDERKNRNERLMLEDTKRRIYAMAKIHQMLYRSKNFSEINFKEYIKALLDEVQKTHCTDQKKITVSLELDPVVLDIERAVPCGLIINELLGNSFKHAFPGKKCGHIKIVLHQKARDLELQIGDDGMGMPAKFLSEKCKTLGLRLVTMLTKQLNGKLSFNGRNGSLFTIIFRNAIIRPGKERMRR